MAHDRRFVHRHPMCTCPDWTPTFRPDDTEPDRSGCRGGTIAHPPPLTAEQVRQVIDYYINRPRPTTEE